MCNFALTVVLATAGPADRVRRRPWIPVLWTAKAAVDAADAMMLAVEHPTRYRRVCVYCLAVTLCALGGVTGTVPEGARAWRRLRAALAGAWRRLRAALAMHRALRAGPEPWPAGWSPA